MDRHFVCGELGYAAGSCLFVKIRRKLAASRAVWHGPVMRSLPGRVGFVLTLVAMSSMQLGCGAGAQKPVAKARLRPTQLVAKQETPQVAAAAGPAFLPSHVVARVDDEQTVPYLARRGDDVLLFYNVHGKLFTRLLGVDGAPKAEPIELGVSVKDMFAAAAVSPLGDGWLLAWVEASTGNSAVRALAVDASGRARGGVSNLMQSADDVSFLEIVAGTNSTLVVWEVLRDDHVDVLAVPFELGQPPPPGVVLANRVLSWGVAAHDQGAAIAMVVDEPRTAGRDDSEGDRLGRMGRVLYADIDAKGKVSSPVVVTPESTVYGDILVARAGNRTHLVWNDLRDLESTIQVASVERGGRIVVPPKRATPPVGDHGLVSLVAGAGSKPRALLAWDDSQQSPRETRLIHVGLLDADANLAPERATVQFSASGPPDIVADGDGFALTTLAPIGSTTRPVTADTPIWPAFVRFGPDLQVRASEPLRAEPFAGTDGIPELTRSLSCHNGTCTTLASVPGPPATYALVGLPIRTSPWQSPASRDSAPVAPHAKAVTSIYHGDHLAKVASTQLAGGTSIAAWVTYYIEPDHDLLVAPKPAKKKEPLATVGIRTVSPTGELGKTQILSNRAVSIGGVAIDVGNAPKTDEALIAWVGRDKAESQVYLAKLGPDGSRLVNKALTTVSRKTPKGAVPNEASDVAIAHVPPMDPKGGADDGWIVAWVDTRDGNAEVYAARVDRQLRKVVTDRRITDAPGDSAEVQVVVRGNEVVLVWSDARQSTEEGNGDIYAVRLDARTLREVGPPIRLFASAGHSRSPSVALAGKDVVVAWIEDAMGETNAADVGVRIAVLDERGALAGVPQLIRGEDKRTLTSVALTCATTRCRLVAASALNDTMQIEAAEFSPGAPPGARKSLLTLIGNTNPDVSPSFANSSGNLLFYGDDGGSDQGRVRFLDIAWPGAK